MVVLGILAAVLVLGLPRLNRGGNNIKSVTRELSVLGKEVRNQARLKNSTYRLVFRMGKDDAYWVESAPGAQISHKVDESLTEDEKKELETQSPFKKVEKFFKGEKKLPGDMQIKRVESASNPDGLTEGLAYVYFSPEGMVEKSIIQIGNKKDVTWTLIYNPLTGHADIVEKAIVLKDTETQ
jgi:general secretion pathway protein H